ncbi:MAG TPA: aminotransferase class I/II-fold pyridoxal phosphate-dependent enzyme, partial [Terriglobus sp.]
MSAEVLAGKKLFSDRINRIEVSATMAITAEALRLKQSGIDLADFGAGEPHFQTPEHIKRAAIEAIEKGYTKYTAVAGIPEVRRAVVDRHAEDFGSSYAVDECCFATGGKQALFNAIECLVDHGDEVIVPVPYWVSYKDIIQFAGGTPVFVQANEADNFRVTPAMIEAAITPRTKCIILNSPSNPSGAVMSAEDVEAIVRLAHRKGIYMLLDECYTYLNFIGKPVSGGSFTDCKEHV